LLLAGANDRIITLEQVTRLETALRNAGAEVKVIVMPFADHGFDGSHRGPAGQLLEDIIPAYLGDVTE
jgi:dienelactone hydrolase